MSPMEIQNDEQYADRTVEDWHRNNLPDYCWAIDIDLVGACSICRQPIYLIESTSSRCKATTILVQFASMTGLPAMTILHDWKKPLYAQMLTHQAKRYHGEDAIKNLLLDIRRDHYRKKHPDTVIDWFEEIVVPFGEE